MEPKRLILTELTVAGENVPPATVRFTPGLNLIVGASDTGKTFIFEALDFMLGAKDGLRRVPEAEGYDRVFLSVEPAGRPGFTLRRGFDGGQAEVTEYPNGRTGPPAPARKLAAAHSADPDASLSAYLLRAIGLQSPQVRKNDRGEKRALSFRDISHLTLIGEERIIRQDSPVVTGNPVQRTGERNAFAYFLSGQDDSQIIAQESTADRNSRLDAETAVTESILSERRAELAGVSSEPAGLADQVVRLDRSIELASEAVVSSQAEISSAESRRAELYNDLILVRSRTGFVGEQLKRLRLLDNYYTSDRARIEAVVEASRVFHELPEGTCPFCNQPVADAVRSQSHEVFEAASLKELRKIEILQRDLRLAIADFLREDAALESFAEQLATDLSEADGRLRRVLAPGSRTAQTQLQDLVKQRTAAAQGEILYANVRGLEERLERIRLTRTRKTPRAAFENRATTGAAFEFCQVIEEILRAWRYPELGTVSFDTDKADLVIGGQDRTNKGKGYRAITYAAFAVGLMKYCRRKGIAHPGFVVLDTPVNPFKGPSAVTGEDSLTDEVKVAFFDYLAADASGDQVIIMENEEPPAAVRARVNYCHFSKNRSVEPYGFFPSRTPTG